MATTKIKTKKMTNIKEFKEFKEFLAEKCFDSKKYQEGKYDRKIYNWIRKYK